MERDLATYIATVQKTILKMNAKTKNLPSAPQAPAQEFSCYADLLKGKTVGMPRDPGTFNIVCGLENVFLSTRTELNMLICGKDSRVTVQVYKPKSIVAIHVAMKIIRYLGGCAGGIGGIACFGHGTYRMPTRDENYVTEMHNEQDEHWSEYRARVLCPGWDALELYGER